MACGSDGLKPYAYKSVHGDEWRFQSWTAPAGRKKPADAQVEAVSEAGSETRLTGDEESGWAVTAPGPVKPAEQLLSGWQDSSPRVSVACSRSFAKVCTDCQLSSAVIASGVGPFPMTFLAPRMESEPDVGRNGKRCTCASTSLTMPSVRSAFTACSHTDSSSSWQLIIRCGSDDSVIVCTAPKMERGWSAVTFPKQGYVWFALRDPRQLTCTLLRFSDSAQSLPASNGWSGSVVGLADVTAFFDFGLAASCRPNCLTERGIRTCLKPDSRGRLSIPYIQGISRVPAGFDQVATIRRGRTVAQSHWFQSPD